MIKPRSNFDNIIKEENKKIGFDLSLLNREPLYVNLIHFDTNMTNKENYKYYTKFKADVVGGFFAMDNIEIFKKYLEAINKKNIPFIIISSGTSGKDIIPICKKYSFIKEVIIFCKETKNHEHLLKEFPNYVKKIFTKISQVYEYIKSFGQKGNIYQQGINDFKKSNTFIFSLEDIKMNKQLQQCPVISAYEYDSCYFLVHRTYAHFFGEIDKDKNNVKFTSQYFDIIKAYINKLDIIDNKEKQNLIAKFESLINKENFVELSIYKYTEESSFCYLFNRAMRNFESGLISLAYYMGPFLYGLNKYVKENPKNFSFNQTMDLYRVIQCSIFDFYLYKLNLNHIICFPSITSTSSVKSQFTPTSQSKNLNNNGINSNDMLNVRMIFHYKHEAGNISPGIIVKDNKTKDGKQMSRFPTENEVILFPFTFARITKIKEISNNKEFEIYFDIINRKKYIEITLKNDVKNRIKFCELD